MHAHYHEDEHLDVLSWPGAGMDKLCDSTLELYAHCKCPLVVVIMAGYNNLVKGRDIGRLKEAILKFRKLLTLRSGSHGNTGHKIDSLSVLSLLPTPETLVL